MRLFRYLPFPALACLFLATACQKDAATPITRFTFQIDTATYNVLGGDALLLDTLGKKALQVRGVTNNFAQNAILLVMLDSANAKPGNYYGTMVFADSILQSDFASNWIGDSIRVSLSVLDGLHATGTFSGQLFQHDSVKTLTNGKFSVSY